MRTVTHRDMRNDSGALLRAVTAGETIQITNNGRVAAIISPATGDTLARLIELGQASSPRRSLAELSGIALRSAPMTSAEFRDDVRGRW